MNEMLEISCTELRELAEANPVEIEVIIEMMIESDTELCKDNS
ncbi:MAG: hypothetical protein P8179_03650 [Candidatus Thiodiazotropha sp.]|jgi:hypothetical protein